MKAYQLFLTAFALVATLFVSCSQEEPVAPVGAEMPIQITISDAGILSTRALTDSEYKTHFETGDAVGLYAVKEGAVVNNIANVRLSYADGMWTPAEPILYTTELEGVTYWAYYPYAAESEFDAAAENPFAGKIAAWTIGSDLSTQELYAASDLMTGSAVATLDNGRYTMDLKLHHRMGMLVVELPSTKYTFTNTEPALEPYMVAAANPAFTVVAGESEQSIVPYYDATTAGYRILLKPETTCSMKGRFEVAGKGQKYTIEFANGVAAGTYELFTVDGGVKEQSLELKVGDYFCADGTIVSYQVGATAPSNAVGVVCQLGTTEGIQAALPHCSHAVVYALKRTERATTEGVNDKTDYKDDAYLSIWSTEAPTSAIDLWAADYGLIGEDNKYNSSDDTKVANGYEMTTAWLSLPLITDKVTTKVTDEETGEVTEVESEVQKDVLQIMRATLAGAVAVPSNTTGWWIPSIYECQLLQEQSEVLNASLEGVGEVLWSDYNSEVNAADDKFAGYWTSTLRRRDAMIGYMPEGDAKVAYLTNRKGYYRFALAF
ncbi:MAG: fimbrillin family protein [Tidjanibacter sp.]|nr:fimbrillin family protein [Tidjanibacter sp.]